MFNKLSKKLSLITLSLLIVFSMPATAIAGEYQSGVNSLSYNQMAIPAYDGDITEEIDGGDPSFTNSEKSQAKENTYDYYSPLDSMGRAGVCEGSLNKSLMPTYSRGSISSIYPTGWVQATYDIVSGKYLYNRCHLIGFQLTGVDNENAKKTYAKQDLITGTRALNVGSGSTGMVKYENMVANYLKEHPSYHVLYRVTPIYGYGNKVAYGVLMEGESIETEDIEFNVFCYNVQPGISIDYETGRSKLTENSDSSSDNTNPEDTGTNTPAKKSITKARITLNKTTWVYTGKEIKPSITVKYNDNLLVKNKDYSVSYSSNVNVGKGCVVIKGINSYDGTYKYYFNIVKKQNPMKAKIKGLKFSKKTLKTKKALVGRASARDAKGTVTYTKVSGSKKLIVTKTSGKIYLKKGTKKGTYKIKVKIHAAGNKYYSPKTVNGVLTVRVH